MLGGGVFQPIRCFEACIYSRVVYTWRGTGANVYGLVLEV